MIGLFCNGLFAKTSVIALDGVNGSIAGGWLDHNWKQMYKQIAYIAAACAYTFVVTALLAKGVDLVPGLHLRASEEAEGLGMDEDQVRVVLSIANRVWQRR
jgi:Amt family ammonium transporter